MQKALRKNALSPWKKTLEEQVAESLRNLIQKKAFEKYLPTERTLGETLDVSRPVLRRALHRLHDEGLVRVVRGHPAQILNAPPRKTGAVSSPRVVMLCSQPPWILGKCFLMIVNEARRKLHERGYGFEEVMDLRLQYKRPEKVLTQVVQHHAADYWILYSLTYPVLNWFQQKGIPAVVMGSTFEGIKLPSVDDDLHAITRHAVGMFLGLGHRRIACFARQFGAAGEIEAERGIKEACQTAPDVIFRRILHSGDPDQIRFQLRALFSKPSKPTAILVTNGMDALVIETYLLACQIKIPAEVSLISLSSEDFLSCITPLPAQYKIDPPKHARWGCSLIQNPLVRGGRVRLLPAFFRGKTLSRAAR